jgi:hypothetical protein
VCWVPLHPIPISIPIPILCRADLFQHRLMSSDDIERGLTSVLSLLDDLLVDMPRAGDQLAELCGQLISSGRIVQFSFLKPALQPAVASGAAQKFIARLLPHMGGHDVRHTSPPIAHAQPSSILTHSPLSLALVQDQVFAFRDGGLTLREFLKDPADEKFIVDNHLAHLSAATAGPARGGGGGGGGGSGANGGASAVAAAADAAPGPVTVSLSLLGPGAPQPTG